MKEITLKYVFWSLALIILVFLLLTVRYAGISCDEVLHYNQSQNVYKYFASGGEDKTSLHSPVWHLMYYGQSFDNIVTIAINWFGIEDVYGFRHLMSSLAGWLTILITGLFGVWLSGYRTGILVLILFAVTPSFIGHSQNNLKDIPFALGYISSIFFLVRFLMSRSRAPVFNIIMLTLSVAFTISIRAAGMVLVFYMFLFAFTFYLIRYYADGKTDLREIVNSLGIITCISFVSYFLSMLLWPYALQNPLINVYKAYRIMAHYPDTFRQIFEGKVEWSDFMPWYYLPKSMVITIPVIVLSGVMIFIMLAKKIIRNEKCLVFAFVIFSLIFPVIFAILEKSNLYSSWRQFLFIYPLLIILAATGFSFLFGMISKKYLKFSLVASLILLAFHPVLYMIRNPHYFYIYYNQLTGGLKGAYGKYETDYYYISQTEASEWLIRYLESNKITGKIKINATYSVNWQFRSYSEIETSYFRYDERSQSDWDYAIVVNRYISPYKLKQGFWPPQNSIHIIYADSVPICAVIERKTKDDFSGYLALKDGRYQDAAGYLEKALKIDDRDEMIFYNFAAALYKLGEKQKAESAMKAALSINPDFEPGLMFIGNVARDEARNDEAISCYEKVIKADRKYFEAYVELSRLLVEKDRIRARKLLRTCLVMNPKYRQAIIALADTYRESDPAIAEKYDKLADSVK
jgi:tetratricopeptide (TPR) repeat protein